MKERLQSYAATATMIYSHDKPPMASDVQSPTLLVEHSSFHAG
jgi:hypothetical protein